MGVFKRWNRIDVWWRVERQVGRLEKIGELDIKIVQMRLSIDAKLFAEPFLFLIQITGYGFK